MLFKKKRKVEELGEIVIPREEIRKEDVKDIEVIKESHGVDLEDEILKKLERLSLTLLLGSGDRETKEKALNMYGRIKFVKAVRGTENEDLIRLFVGMDVTEDFVERLRGKGFIEKTYRLSGVDIKAKDKEEIAKKLEELVKEEFELKDDVREVLSGRPFLVNDERIEIVEKLNELGAFEIYLLPKGWFDIPNINNLDVERAMREFRELTESLPQHIAKFLEI
ncbi:MAG: hypothetical protein DRP01_10385 [Archaeoglobales archaeon]|nr:MAG: hypothetical protein DRP01_10385 [Archaeoglobales archaeon]